MFSRSLTCVALPAIFVILCGSCIGQPKWEFELLEVHHWSNDESLLSSNLARKRLNRTAVIDGEVEWKFDADGSTTFEMQVYSSPNNGEYKLEPYEVPQQSLFDFLSGPVYKEILYPTVAHCSNLPKVEKDDKFVPPLEQQTFNFDNCYPNIESLPNIVKPDFLYKVIFLFGGQVHANFTNVYQAVALHS